MPPVEHAASTLIGQWGPAGVIIVGLAAMLVGMFKFFQAQLEKMMANEKTERAEMRQVHAAERADLQRANQQNYDRGLEVAKENTASNRAVEQVVRELTGVIGRAEGLGMKRGNGG